MHARRHIAVSSARNDNVCTSTNDNVWKCADNNCWKCTDNNCWQRSNHDDRRRCALCNYCRAGKQQSDSGDHVRRFAVCISCHRRSCYRFAIIKMLCSVRRVSRYGFQLHKTTLSTEPRVRRARPKASRTSSLRKSCCCLDSHFACSQRRFRS